jgi:hypothetical protein
MSHLSVQTQLETVSSNLHYYVQTRVQLLSILSMNKCIVFLHFLYKGISSNYIITFYIYLCSNFCIFRATFCVTNPDYRLIRMTSPPPPNYSRLARVSVKSYDPPDRLHTLNQPHIT